MPDPVWLLRDGQVMLRRWRRDDLDTLVLHADDPAVSCGLADRFPHPYTRADGEAFLDGRVLDLEGPVFALVIDGQACGSIGATLGTGERRCSASLGYWLGQRHWRRGIMTDVVAAYAPWLMERYGLSRLQAEVLDFNEASARVLLGNGFVEEGRARAAVIKRGVLHDLRRFALTRAAVGTMIGAHGAM